MTMKQPHPRIIALEPQHDMSIRPHQQSIPSHRPLRKRHTSIENGIRIIVSRIIVSTQDSLECVAVQMEGMFAGIVVVEDDFNDLVLA